MHTNSTFVFPLNVKNVVFAEGEFVWDGDGIIFRGDGWSGRINGPGVWEKESDRLKVEWIVEESGIIGDFEKSLVFCKYTKHSMIFTIHFN
jgi:hypothetical protein